MPKNSSISFDIQLGCEHGTTGSASSRRCEHGTVTVEQRAAACWLQFLVRREKERERD
jgi:hypothetical protein